MGFDLKAARKRGYDDEHLANYLGKKLDFDVGAAVKAGKTHTELAEYLSTFDAPTRLEADVPRTPEWAAQSPNLYGMFGAGKALYEQVARPSIEAGGFLGGAALGAPAGIPGAVGGAASGYAIAKKIDEIITNQINRIEGVRDKSTVAEETVASLHDLKDGLIMEMAGRAAPVIPLSIYNKIAAPFSGKIVPEAELLRNLAKADAGIQYTPAEQTQSRILGAVEGLVKRAPASAEIIQNWRFKNQLQPLLQQREQLIAAGGGQTDIKQLGNKIYIEVTSYLQEVEKVQGKQLNVLRREVLARMGTIASPETLGLTTQEILKTNAVAARQRARNAYNELSDLPDLTDKRFVPERMKEYAQVEIKSTKKLSKSARAAASEDLQWASDQRQIPPEVASQLDALPPGPQKEQIMTEIAQATERKLTWQEMQTYEDHLTAMMKKADPLIDVRGISQLTPEGRIYSNLRRELRIDMEEIAKATGGDVWAQYKTADVLWGDYARVYKSKEIQKLFKSHPERVIDTAIRPGAVTEIKTLKNALGPKGFQEVQEGFTNKLFGESDIFDPRSLGARINQYGRRTIEEVYGPRAFDKLAEIAKHGLDLTKVRIGSQFLKKLQSKYGNQLLDSIIDASASRKGDTNLFYNLATMKEVLEKPTYDKLENEVIARIFDTDPVSGLVNPQKLVKMFDTHGQTLSFLDKKKTEGLRKVVDYARRIGKSAGELVETPALDVGEGSVVSFRTAHLLLARPKLGFVEAVSTYPLTKLYLSKFGMKWLTEGFKVKAGTRKGLELAAKLAQLFKEDIRNIVAPQMGEE